MAQIQDISSRWICDDVSQLSKTKSNSDSLFLNKFPVEILLIIHSFLPASSQLCLLTTCRGMKVLLECRNRTVPYSRLTLEQKQEYKTFVIRQFPNAWLDEETLRFREFQEEDLYPQPQGPLLGNQPGWNRYTWHFARGALLIGHRHVRMSLIYHGLEKKTRQQMSFLKSLLEPYHTDFSPGFRIHTSEKIGVVGHFESHPKLVSGRYLLFNIWTFTNPLRGGMVKINKLGNFGVCTHQVMSRLDRRAFVVHRSRDVESSIRATHFLRTWPRSPLNEELIICIHEAFKTPGSQVDGMCPYCLTEFSICTTKKKMEMRVWRDLGTEDSWLSPVWQTHLGKVDPQGLPRGDNCLEIRSRYGDTEQLRH